MHRLLPATQTGKLGPISPVSVPEHRAITQGEVVDRVSCRISGYPKHIIDIKGRFRSLPWGLKVTLREIVLHMNTKQNWEASNEAQLQLGSLAADM
ncbi:hypothetical protein FRB95_013676 [Tulasnella sp. JGI-2019a]|nr:hypothetical protein FRB95_013676 [Tulasnella sp. JGI-2019a]